MSDVVESDVANAEHDMHERQASRDYRPGAVLTNKYTRTEARQRLDKLRGETSLLEFHAVAGTPRVTWDMVTQNHDTLGLLQDYANTRDEEATDIGAVLTGNKALQVDFARLNAAVAAVQREAGITVSAIKGAATPENPVDQTKPLNAEGQLGQKVGEKFGDVVVGGDKETAKEGSAKLGEMRTMVNTLMGDYDAACGDVNTTESHVKECSAKLSSATSSLTLFNLKQENKEIAGQLQAAQREAQGIADTVSMVTGLVVQCSGITGGLASAAGGGALAELKPSLDPLIGMLDAKGKEGAMGSVNDVITTVLTHTSGIAKKIANLTGKLNVNELKQMQAQKQQEGAAVTAAAEALSGAVSGYKTKLGLVNSKKRALRTALVDYGAKLDEKSKTDGTGSGDRFKILGRVMGECDAFLGQAKIVWTSIQRAKASRANANDKRDEIATTVKGSDGVDRGAGAYFITSHALDNGGVYFLVNVENITMQKLDIPGQSGQATPAEALATAESDIRRNGSMAYGMRNQLAGFMGLSVNGSPPDFTGAD